MYISHSSKIPGQSRDELRWEEEKNEYRYKIGVQESPLCSYGAI